MRLAVGPAGGSINAARVEVTSLLGFTPPKLLPYLNRDDENPPGEGLPLRIERGQGGDFYSRRGKKLQQTGIKLRKTIWRRNNSSI